MSIKATMQASFGALFNDQFAEAVSSFTGSYLGPGIYDPVTEETTAQPVTYTGRGVLTRYKKDQVDNDRILATDVRVIALVNEVTDHPMPGHEVSAKDLITEEMRDYRVIEAVTDPIGVHYQIQLRVI
jgi:hypothetical protein